MASSEKGSRRPVGLDSPSSTAPPHTPFPFAASHKPTVASTLPGTAGGFAPDISDRVFPMRSVVSIEPPPYISGSTDIPNEGSRYRSSVSGAGSQSQSSSISSFPKILPASPLPPRDIESEQTVPGFYTTRHKHFVSEDGHMFVTVVAGAEKMQRCEDEPIHIPGAIQSFGCLLALRERDGGTVLDIRIVSENVEGILGYSPHELFERQDFFAILSDDQAENFVDHLEFVRGDKDTRIDGPEVFSIAVTGPKAVQTRLWCAIHMPEGNRGLIICEFELEEDNRCPLSQASDELASPEDTLESTPTQEEFIESTLSMSRPLRILRHTRKRRGEAAAMEVFSLMSQIQGQLASANNFQEFLDVVVGVVKELTGFHRVMIYQFDEDWNGRVVSELVDSQATKDLYRGLNFPASDIPAQARALYKLNKVRLLYDRDQPTARLVCKTQEDIAAPLDLTHSYLRAMSPIHLKYLENMKVRASMSISITAFGQLWGLVSCHTYGPTGMRVSFPIRKVCRLIGESASRNIERLSYARRLRVRKFTNTVPTEQNPSGYIVASSDDLLKLFDADCGLLSIRGETKALGVLDDSQEALAMLEYLRIRNYTMVTTSQNITRDFPDLKYKPGFRVIAGLLVVPLSVKGDDFIIFFRKPQLRHVHWAGNPYEKEIKAGTEGFLQPRSSFKLWSETVVGKSREWTEEQVETAAVLCLVYGKFIEVWRRKEAASKSSQLARLLLANASHEVRTPLNAIINYLEIALEGPLDQETRDNLDRSHTASKSLIYVINDLLDLTRTEEGHNLVREEILDLRKIIHEVTDVFKADAERKKISFEVVELSGLPALVKGDPARLRQAISNITANAIAYTAEGGVRIEVWTYDFDNGKCMVGIAVDDTGVGMSATDLDTLFRELEQVHTEEEDTEQSSRAPIHAFPKAPGQGVLGLGLAVVARSIWNMNGQLRLKSKEGCGSRFTICVPLLHNTAEKGDSKIIEPPVESIIPYSASPGELTLSRTPSITKRRSSGGSQGSNRLEIERIVCAVSSPSLPEGPASQVPPTGFTRPPNASPTGPQTTTAPASDESGVGPELASGNVAPVGPAKVPDDGVALAAASSTSASPQSSPPEAKHAPSPEPKIAAPSKFTVLVAEDDPINSKIMKKRLEKMGHDVVLTVNGEECLEKFGEAGEEYDVVLMDMQMPMMDGGTSASLIRDLEARNPHSIPRKHANNGRAPIFAVSASLFEERRPGYLDLGFDGWILKPIDFKRLEKLLEGTRDAEIRKEAEYVPGEWERGGWFLGTAPSRPVPKVP